MFHIISFTHWVKLLLSAHNLDNDDEALKNFNHVLELENWIPVYYSANFDDAFDNFVHILMNHYNRRCPLKRSQNQNKVQIKCGLQMD